MWEILQPDRQITIKIGQYIKMGNIILKLIETSLLDI